MDSVEATNTLVLYEPASFNEIMRNDQLITIPTGTIKVKDPPAWLTTLHEQIAAAHNQVRVIALAIGQEHAQELTTLKEQYDILKKSYNVVADLFDAGIEAAQSSVVRLEQQVQQASSRFASEVWAVVAQYGKKDEERRKAIQHLQDASLKHQQALEALHEKATRQ